jgi:hypothetical protein
MTLVEDAGKAWKWFSMWAMGLSTAVLTAWAVIPDDLKAYVTGMVPPKYMGLGVAGVLVLGMLGRLVKQGEKP